MNATRISRWAGSIAVLLAAGCHNARVQPAIQPAGPGTINPKVKIETTLGDIVIELDGENAPRTVMNFVQYVRDGFYDGTVFHRVIDTFTIQGGGFTPDMEKKTRGLRPGINNEWNNGLVNEFATIAMARLGNQPESAQAEFFINVADNFVLNSPRDGAGYCVFGRVVDGLDTVEKIKTTPVGPHPKWDQGRRPHVPITPVVITSARLLDRFDRDWAQQVAETYVTPQERFKVNARRELEERIAAIEKEAGRKSVTTETGLIFVDHRIGTGLTPTLNNSVMIHYRGTFVDGEVFDSSYEQADPPMLPLSNTLDGWQEGLQSMAVGGKRTLIIPADLAFGFRGHPPTGVPGGTTVVYEVELLAIQ